ncbi:MAG: hypothetical protein R3D84_01205 [Paracoccaceae bacterium]
MARSKKPPTEKPEQAADENVTEAAEEVRQETGQDEAESEPVELAEPKPPAAEPEPGPDDLQATTWPDHNDAVAATTPVQPRRGGMLGPVLAVCWPLVWASACRSWARSAGCRRWIG